MINIILFYCADLQNYRKSRKNKCYIYFVGNCGLILNWMINISTTVVDPSTYILNKNAEYPLCSIIQRLNKQFKF